MISNTKLIKLAIIVISIGLWCINFFYVHEGKDIRFRIAKGFGLNLRCWTMFLYGTMCRTLLHGKIEKHVVYHKFIGYIMIICAIGHSVAHMIYSRIIDKEHITGYILLTMFILMTIGYTSRFFQSYISWSYSFFKYIHYFYYLILPLMIVHITKYWVWFGVPLIIFAIEIFLNFHKLQYSKIKNIDRQADHMFISVPRIIDAVPGSYYYLCVPSLYKIKFLGLMEWHPFSLCSSSHINHLTFMIEAKGDWTRKFYNSIEFKNKDVTLLVMGPFRTSSSLIMNSDVDKKTIICTGVGISPFISVINTKIDEYHTNDNYRIDYSNVFNTDIEQQRAHSLLSGDGILGNTFSSDFHGSIYFHNEKSNKCNTIVTYKTSSLDIHWTFRDPKKVKNLFKYIRKILTRSININLYIYITAKINDNDKVSFIEKYQSYGIKSIIFDRMDLDFLINNPNKEVTKQVYFCGSPALRESVKEYCNKENITFYSEVF